MLLKLNLEPKLSALHSSGVLSAQLTENYQAIGQLMLEGRNRPDQSIRGLVGHVIKLAKRGDPLLSTHALSLAKLILSMHLISQVLSKKTGRTSIILQDIFHKIDQRTEQQRRIDASTSVVGTIQQAIDNAFATRRMKHDLRQMVDDVFEVVDKKIGAQHDHLRALTALIRHSGRDQSALDQLTQFLDQLVVNK